MFLFSPRESVLIRFLPQLSLESLASLPTHTCFVLLSAVLTLRATGARVLSHCLAKPVHATLR
jgi:hypothetical protein